MSGFTRVVRAVLPLVGVYAAVSCACADENVNSALKGRDVNAIMQILKADGQAPEAAPAPVAVAAPVVPATPAPAAPAPSTAATPPAPVPPPAPAPTAPTIATPAAPAPASVPGDDLKAFREQLSTEIASARSEQAGKVEAVAAPAAAPAAPVEAAPEKKKGLLGRIFGSSDKPEEAAPAVEPAPPVHAAPDRPEVRSDAMARNREALDALVRRSREDVVRMAMGQISGTPADAAPAEEDDAWKKAGPSAWRYNGEWDNGTMQGQGHMVYGDGWEYSGAWKAGVMDGQGTLSYPDGTRYEGQWRNGRMHGLGKLTYPDGWSFIGQWRDGVISGQGTLIHPGR